METKNHYLGKHVFQEEIRQDLMSMIKLARRPKRWKDIMNWLEEFGDEDGDGMEGMDDIGSTIYNDIANSIESINNAFNTIEMALSIRYKLRKKDIAEEEENEDSDDSVAIAIFRMLDKKILHRMASEHYDLNELIQEEIERKDRLKK